MFMFEERNKHTILYGGVFKTLSKWGSAKVLHVAAKINTDK